MIREVTGRSRCFICALLDVYNDSDSVTAVKSGNFSRMLGKRDNLAYTGRCSIYSILSLYNARRGSMLHCRFTDRFVDLPRHVADPSSADALGCF